MCAPGTTLPGHGGTTVLAVSTVGQNILGNGETSVLGCAHKGAAQLGDRRLKYWVVARRGQQCLVVRESAV